MLKLKLRKKDKVMVLAGKDFTPTESTHGRRIWRLREADPVADEQEPSGDSREVMLWDLAGQPGYRIVHQLHLEIRPGSKSGDQRSRPAESAQISLCLVQSAGMDGADRWPGNLVPDRVQWRGLYRFRR